MSGESHNGSGPSVQQQGHHTSLEYHRALLDDTARVSAYERALRELVGPGDVVLDVGTGTGLLAMLAARRGAARVIAVEAADVAGIARALVDDNGLSEVVEVIQADVIGLDPTAEVDLVVSEFMGRFLVDDLMLDAVEAAGRWMAPDARFCPSEVALHLAPVSLPLWAVDRFESPLLGLDLSAALPSALNFCYWGQLSREAVLGSSANYHRLRPPAPAPPFDREVVMEVERPGRLRAVAGWFEAVLSPGVTLSTAPGSDTHWGQYLFPVPACEVVAGDRLRLRLWLDEDRGVEPVWCWRGSVERGGEALCAFDLESTQRLGERLPEVRGVPVRVQGRESISEENRLGAEAFLAGRLHEAAGYYERAIAALGPGEDDLAPPLFENMGLAALNLGRYRDATHAFLRALDGDLVSREQSLRYLVVCLAREGRSLAMAEALGRYERAFGPYPETTGG